MNNAQIRERSPNEFLRDHRARNGNIRIETDAKHSFFSLFVQPAA